MDQNTLLKSCEAVAKKAVEEGFKAELMADPLKVCSEHKIAVPKGVSIRVSENKDGSLHLEVTGQEPDELTDNELEGAAGGTSIYYTH